MNKNTKLSVILAGLILVSVFISLTGKEDNRQSFDPQMFTVMDTSMIESVVISSNKINEITRGNGIWRLNNNFNADLNMIEVMKSILSQVKVKRTVAKLNQVDIIKDLKQTGKKVTVNYSDGSASSFVAGGNS
jgi:hypothetical protein